MLSSKHPAIHMASKASRQDQQDQQYSSSKSLAVNGTRINQIITLCAIWLLKSVRRQFGPCLFVTHNVCVKYGEFIDLSEAATLVYIRNNTSVPVPKVYCAFKRRGQTYIVMERIKGHKLAIGWLERSEQSKSCILAQLRKMVDEMRTCKSPHGSAVCNVDGGSLYDMRLPGLGLRYPEVTPIRFGPFPDVARFHRWLRRPAFVVRESYRNEINRLINLHENTEWGSPVLTHGDLSSLNIMVQGEKVMGIVDWETAGWYPSYWEFTTASQVNFRNEMWADYIERFLEPRREELEMEKIRQEFFGDT